MNICFLSVMQFLEKYLNARNQYYVSNIIIELGVMFLWF